MFLLTGIINKYHIGKGLKSKTFIPQGFYLNLRLDDWLQQQIYFLGSYENYELQVLKSKLNQGSIMIDIGANIGLYSFFSASIVGETGKVISFEPYSLNFNIFKENLALNKFENIILNRIALADKNDVIELFYNPKELNLGMVSAFEKNFEEFETVNCTTLDYYLMDKNLTKIDFIKMDIEGGEYLALLGMNETIKKFRPFVQIEIDEDIIAQTPYLKNDILLFFEMNNYKSVNPVIANVKREKWSKNYFFKPS